MQRQRVLKQRSLPAQPTFVGQDSFLAAPNDSLHQAPRNRRHTEKEAKEPSIEERKAALEHGSGPCRIVLLHYRHENFVVEKCVSAGIYGMIGRWPQGDPRKTILKLE